MTVSERPARRSVRTGALKAAIFDVDGVLLASPHERAWREALRGFADPDLFTTAMYQAQVAGKPRLTGARAALEALGVVDAERQAVPYAERKQKRLEELIEKGSVTAFPDALRFVQAVSALGWPMAVASSSKNANGMMRLIRLELWPKPARGVRCQCLRARPAEGQAGPGDFPAGGQGTAHCARTLLRRRGRPGRRRGGPRGWHDGARRCPSQRRSAAANSGCGPGGDQSR